MSVSTEADVPAVEPALMDAPADDKAVVEAPKADDVVVETPEQKAEREAVEAAAVDKDEPVEETDEEKAARLAAETPEQKAEREAKEAEEAKAAEGYPEEGYTDFTAPEGVALNAEAVDALKAFGKDNNLSQAQTQMVVDMGTKLMGDWQKGLVDQFAATRTEWREASQNDNEFGGAKLNENLPVAVKARDHFGTPELKSMLDEYGLGDHPEVIRFFWKVGKAMSEDSFVAPGKPTGEQSTAKLIFDHPSNQRKSA